MHQTRRHNLLVLGSIVVRLFMFRGECWAEEEKLSLNLAFKEEYTDNVFLVARNVATDWITTLSPQIHYSKRTERLDAGLSITVDSLYYVNNDNLNNIEQTYEGRFSYLLSPVLRVRTNASYAQDSGVDRDITTSGLTQSTGRRQRQRYGVGVDYTLSEKTSVNLDYDFNQDKYENQDSSGYRANLVSAGVAYNLSKYFENTTARSNLRCEFYEFSNSIMENYTWTVGLRKELSEIWSLDVNVGGRLTRSEVHYDFWGWRFVNSREEFGSTGSVALNYLGEVTSGTLAFSHDVQPASGWGSATKRTSLKFNIFRRLTEDFWISLGTDYFMNSSDGTFGSSAINEKTLLISPQLSYGFTDELRLDSSYQFILIKDDAANNNDRKRNSIWFKLDYAYPLFE